MPPETRNWFDQRGDAYARYRPDYPDELARFLAGVSPDTGTAVDVGCGNGQLTRQLAGYFDAVVGLDPSVEQIAHAMRHERVRYAVASAEQLGVASHRFSLITAAQAAHWFDLSRFYGEVRRVARPGAVLALISYGVLRLEEGLHDRFVTFYTDEIGAYWPPERRLVDGGYTELAFPFPEMPRPALEIRRQWNAHAFLGYVSTWSATRRAREAGQEAMLSAFSRDLLALWGDPERVRPLVWPINLRLGRVAFARE
jgi:SAM-dependent methyltransferase